MRLCRCGFSALPRELFRRCFYRLWIAQFSEARVRAARGAARYAPGGRYRKPGLFSARTACAALVLSVVSILPGRRVGALVTRATAHLHIHSGFTPKFSDRKRIFCIAAKNWISGRGSAYFLVRRHRPALGKRGHGQYTIM